VIFVANPQIQNGYTKIANELLEAICRLNISGNEMRILLYIIRRTYGFNRKFSEIPLSDIASAVGMRNEHVSKALKRLSSRKIIELHANKGVKPQTISIVKNYDEWSVESCTNLLLPKMATVAENGNTTIAENGNSTIAKNGNTTIAKNGNPTLYKENKENIKERVKEKTPYGNFKNVLLTDEEYDQLVYDYGRDNAERYIERVDSWVQSTGKERADYYATIRLWLEKDDVEKYDHKYDFVINNF
jgi:phage replication O-like protein O